MNSSSVNTLDLINSSRSESETEHEDSQLNQDDDEDKQSLASSTTEIANDDDKVSQILDLVPVEPISDNNYNKNLDSSWLEENKAHHDEKNGSSSPPLVEDDDVDTSDLNHLEPKLREAWIEMRRLDKKLAALVKKEKRTRLETKALVENNKKGWEQFKLTSNYVESKMEAQITQKFYALSYPDLDEDDWLGERSHDDELHTPVFKTQGPYDEIDETTLESPNDKPLNADSDPFNKPKNHSNIKKPNTKKGSIDDSKSSFIGTAQTESIHSNSMKTGKASTTASSSKKQNKSEKDKDFIKRNIKLAKDQGGVLAMTEEEKSRLNSLLSDLADESDQTGRPAIQASVVDEKLTYMVDYQPSLVVLDQGDGFTPTQEENERLRRIENQLKQRRASSLIPNENVSIISSNHNPASSWVDFNSQIAPSTDAPRTDLVQIKLNDEFDEDEFGDRFVREARIHREEEQRLRFIDSRLKEIHDQQSLALRNDESSLDYISNDERKVSVIEESNLSEHQLRKLLQDCYSELGLSEADPQEFDRISEKSRVPILDEHQLRNLLEELGVGETISSANTESRSTNYSYYEEALKIVENKQKLTEKAFRTLEKEEENVSMEQESQKSDGKQAIENQENNNENEPRRTFSAKSENLAYDQYQTPKLPLIQNDYNKNNPQNTTPSRLSMASRNSFAESSTNSLILPKIEDRHLPK